MDPLEPGWLPDIDKMSDLVEQELIEIRSNQTDQLMFRPSSVEICDAKLILWIKEKD